MAWFPSFRSYMDCSRPTDEAWATQSIFTRRQACWRKVISDGDITHFMGGVVIMVSICAHVPMSPRARTSVPDDRSGYKGTKKEWTRTIWDADWDLLRDELLWSVVHWLSCSSLSACNPSWFKHSSVEGAFGIPPLRAVFFVPCHFRRSWDSLAATGFQCVLLSVLHEKCVHNICGSSGSVRSSGLDT